ncbi:MAG: lysylphosphatidylglycerol synthase transmembrane domain-containing protein [Bacteroidota bacterium]
MQAKKLIVNILKALLFAGIGATILYLLYRGQNVEYQLFCQEEGIAEENCSLLQKIWKDFQSVNYLWIFIIIGCYTISNFSRAARWLMLIRPLGYQARFWNAFFTIMLGYFTNLGIPRIGEFIRAASMSRYEKIPTEKLVGTIVVGRTFDFIMLFTAMGLAFLLEFDTLWNYLVANFDLSAKFGGLLSSNLLGILIGVAVMSLVLFYVFKTKIQSLSIYQKGLDILKGFADGIQSIRKLERPWLFLFHTVNIWIMYFLMTYLAFFAFEPTSGLSPVAGLMIFIFGAFGFVVPAPGGMGAYQFFVTEGLAIYGINGNDAFSFANIIFFSLQIGSNVLLGLISLVALPLLNRGTKREEEVIN